MVVPRVLQGKDATGCFDALGCVPITTFGQRRHRVHSCRLLPGEWFAVCFPGPPPALPPASSRPPLHPSQRGARRVFDVAAPTDHPVVDKLYPLFHSHGKHPCRAWQCTDPSYHSHQFHIGQSCLHDTPAVSSTSPTGSPYHQLTNTLVYLIGQPCQMNNFYWITNHQLLSVSLSDTNPH